MTVLTNVRAGRVTALFAAFQAALGTPIATFTTAHRLWSDSAELSIDAGHTVEPGMQEGEAPLSASIYRNPDMPAGRLTFKATPASLRTALDSNWGAFSAGAWSLASQVTDTRRLTLGWCENSAAQVGKIVRVRDAWFHRVTLAVDSRTGMLMLECDYAGRVELNAALSGGGVTLPSAPMQPADKDVFPKRLVTLRRDPASANVSLRFDELRLTLEHGLLHEYGMGGGCAEVWKAGPARARLEVVTRYADETWQVLTNSLASTKQRYRLTCVTDDASPSTLTIDLYELLLKAERVGHEGKDYATARFVGEAAVDSSGNFVSLALA